MKFACFDYYQFDVFKIGKFYKFIGRRMTEIEPSLVELNSPTRTAAQSFTKASLAKTRADDNFTTCFSLNTKMSATQRQIFSHPLVKQIVDARKKNSIQHDVNRVSAQTKLYNVPQQPTTNQFVFDAIPPNNPYFVSTSSQKVHEIHHRLSDNRDLCQRLLELANKNIKILQSKKSERSSTAPNTDRRVSVSGLVSYNFNSVTARRSLGSIPDMPEDLVLANKKKQVRAKNSCSVDRQMKMIRRKPNPNSINKIQMAKAAICEFSTPTEQFLKKFVRQNERNLPIYGEKMQKLICVKQFMEKQKVDYEHANFIVQAVINSQKKQKPQKMKRSKIIVDDEFQLSKRKQALSRRKIMLKHLYFTE